jgi:hypothetical protein
MSIVEIAEKYIGETEKPGNMGFNDAEFESKMKSVGFQKTHAWCAYFAELVFKEALPEKYTELDALFSAGTVQTFRNFKDAAFLIGNAPHAGDLVIWQTMKDGKPQTTGHAGIVHSAVSNTEFWSIEGNTNDGGGREGYIVAKRIRKVIPDVKNGLKILGFIQIK